MHRGNREARVKNQGMEGCPPWVLHRYLHRQPGRPNTNNTNTCFRQIDYSTSPATRRMTVHSHHSCPLFFAYGGPSSLRLPVACGCCRPRRRATSICIHIHICISIPIPSPSPSQSPSHLRHPSLYFSSLAPPPSISDRAPRRATLALPQQLAAPQ